MGESPALVLISHPSSSAVSFRMHLSLHVILFFFFFSFLCLDFSPVLWHQINKEMRERLIQRARSLASFTRRVDFCLPMCAEWDPTTNCFIDHAHWVLLPLDWLGHWYPLASETRSTLILGQVHTSTYDLLSQWGSSEFDSELDSTGCIRFYFSSINLECGIFFREVRQFDVC